MQRVKPGVEGAAVAMLSASARREQGNRGAHHVREQSPILPHAGFRRGAGCLGRPTPGHLPLAPPPYDCWNKSHHAAIPAASTAAMDPFTFASSSTLHLSVAVKVWVVLAPHHPSACANRPRSPPVPASKAMKSRSPTRPSSSARTSGTAAVISARTASSMSLFSLSPTRSLLRSTRRRRTSTLRMGACGTSG